MSVNHIESAITNMEAEDGPTITVKLNRQGLDFRFFLFGRPHEIVKDGLEVMDLRQILEQCEFHPYQVAVPDVDNKVLVLTYPKGASQAVVSGCMVALMARLNKQCDTRDALYYRVTGTRQVLPQGQKPIGEEVVHPWTHDAMAAAR